MLSQRAGFPLVGKASEPRVRISQMRRSDGLAVERLVGIEYALIVAARFLNFGVLTEGPSAVSAATVAFAVDLLVAFLEFEVFAFFAEGALALPGASSSSPTAC